MKRLATMVGVAGVIGLTGTAMADPSPVSRQKRPCVQQADAIVRTGVEGLVAAELGADVRKQTLRTFFCYWVNDGLLSDGPFAGVASVWVQPEHGTVGVTCAGRHEWEGVPCGHNPMTLPLRATTPVDHPQGPWGFHLLGIDFGYAFDPSTTSVSARAGECVAERCVTTDELRAGVRRGFEYRIPGWRCTAGAQGSCVASSGAPGATVGEQDAQPTMTVGGLAVDVPSVCVEAATDPRC